MDKNTEVIHLTNKGLLSNGADSEKHFFDRIPEKSKDLESAVRYFLEFLHGFESLDIKGPCVTVFGSARFKPDHKYYEMARALGKRLAQEGFVVMTGGGPGIMEAANRGAKEGGGYTIGCNIILPHEQKPNPYLDKFVEFQHFFVRKVMLLKYSVAFVVMPGGLGTMDEVFETLTLIQCNKIEKFPVVAMGSEFWDKLHCFIDSTLVSEHTISLEDQDLFTVTDSVDEVVEKIASSIPEYHMELVRKASWLN